MARNRITEAIAKVRESIAAGRKIDGSGPIDAESLTSLQATLAVDFTEHFAYQDAQAWAHVSGIISTDEAQTIYVALGEVGSPDNGGWAAGTDLATKVVITEVVGSILRVKMRAFAGGMPA